MVSSLIAYGLREQGVKPFPWAIQKGLVAPEFQDLWTPDLLVAMPFLAPTSTGQVPYYNYATRKFETSIATRGTVGADGYAIDCDTDRAERVLPFDDDLLFGEGAATVLIRAKWDGGVDAVADELFGCWQSGKRAFMFRYDSTNGWIEGFVYTSSQAGGNVTDFDIADGEYHSLAMRYDGANINFWLDGKKSTVSFSLTGNIGEASVGLWRLNEAGNAPGQRGRFDYSQIQVYKLALPDGLIERWSRDWNGMYRPDYSRFFPAGAAAVAAGQTVGTGLLTGLKLQRPRLVA